MEKAPANAGAFAQLPGDSARGAGSGPVSLRVSLRAA